MIYLDNAATSFPKPAAVKRAVSAALDIPLGNPGRGGHSAAQKAGELCFTLREKLNSLFGGAGEERVIFCKSATEAINLALFGALEDRRDCPSVVTTLWEHNAVLRPLYALERANKIRLVFFDPARGLDALKKAMGNSTALCAFTCRSNVSGARTDYPAFCKFAKERGALILLDASQEAGKRAISLKDLGADYLSFPAHKGLLALPGLGILMLSKSAPDPAPRVFGGTGFAAEERIMPALLPEGLEAGTLPVHLIAALNASLSYLETHTAKGKLLRAGLLAEKLKTALLENGYVLYAQNGELVLFNHPDLPSETLAGKLAERGICVRAGLHCAPLIHKSLGTLQTGAVRLSVGPFNVEREIDQTIRVLKSLR